MRLHVLAATDNGKLWHTIRRTDQTWFPFGDVELETGDRGKVVDSSSATDSEGNLHIVVVTDNGKLWHAIRHETNNGKWDVLGDVEGQGGAGERGFITAVAAAADGLELHVLAATDDGKLWHTIRHSDVVGTWEPFRNVETETGERGRFISLAAASTF